MTETHVVTDVAAVLGVGALTGFIARRLGQPTILGYLIAGLIVGPYLNVPIFANPQRVQALGEFGVVLVMFAIGLEFRIAKLVSVLPTAGFTGVIQIASLMYCGFSLGQSIGWDSTGSLFLGASIAISSTMVVSKVFEQHPLDDDSRQTVLGVLVIQDVVAIVLIAALTGVAKGGGLAPRELGMMLVKLAGVLIGLLAFGLLIVPRIVKRVARLNSPELDVVTAVGLCFPLAVLAQYLGYSVALGAFIAGILVAESGLGERVEHAIQPVRDMFAAIFFVSIGMTVDPRQAAGNIGTSLLVFVVVVVVQFLSVGVASVLSGNGLRRSVIAGLSLGQIGEFAFILAAIGEGAKVVPRGLQSVLVTVAVMTSFTTPLAIRFSERIVHTVDVLLPRRIRNLIALHEEWVVRVRTRDHAPSPPTRKALNAVVLDAAGLFVLLGAVAMIRSPILAWLSDLVRVKVHVARLGLTIFVFVLGAPLMFALARNARAFARHRASGLGPTPEVVKAAKEAGATGEVDDDGTVREAAGSRALIAMLTVLVLAAVALPFSAGLSLLVGGLYTTLGLAVGVASVGAYLWRTASDTETEYQSAVRALGHALATGPDAAPERLSIPMLLPGLDDVVLVRVGDGPAAGKTLAELDLRARSGATVVAVRGAAGSMTLPSGSQRLAAGDVIALSGTTDAIESARRLLATRFPGA